MILQQKKASLILADGTVYTGYSFGKAGTALGQVVFNTQVVGFQETLTDPASFGQLVVQTFPLVGNYGVNDEDSQSGQVHARGMIVREWCQEPSNFRSTGNLDDYLRENGVVGIYGLDTRALTRRLRDVGAMNGIITTEEIGGQMGELLASVQAFSIRDAVEAVAATAVETFPAENPKYKVALYDYGCKKSLIQWLGSQGCTVIKLPPLTPAAEVQALGVDGVVLSDGPGSPSDNPEIIENLRALAKTGLPILGVGLGHLLLALSQGGAVAAMPHGHRGGQPVTDLALGRTYMTQQNHGFVVESIPPEVGEVSHRSSSDGSCEGVRYTALPALGIQFDPQVAFGPRAANYIFDRFAALLER